MILLLAGISGISIWALVRNWSLFISRGGEGKEGGVFLKGEHDFGSIRGGISCRLQSINGGLWKIYCQLPGNQWGHKNVAQS